MSRELNLYLGGRRVGRLVDVGGIWSFEYIDEWRAGGFGLSPGLPLQAEPIIDRGRVRPVQWFFENLLPANAPSARPVPGAERDPHDPWHQLRTLGEETAGAIRLRPPAGSGPDTPSLGAPQSPYHARAVFLDAAGRIAEPGDGSPASRAIGNTDDANGANEFTSTHFMIPDAADGLYPASTANAWYCARVAQELGFDVPAVELRFEPDSALLVGRFDRRRAGERVEARHVIDGAQLLSQPAMARPAAAGVQALRDIVQRCRAKAPTRIALFRWMVFNVLTGNPNAHLKALAFLGGPEGYALAPHGGFVSPVAWLRPELQPAESILPDVVLENPIGDAKRYADLRRSHLVAFGHELGLPDVSIARELDRLAGRIAGAADRVLAEYDARTDVPRRLRAGQRRLIATIRNMPIAEMSRRLLAFRT